MADINIPRIGGDKETQRKFYVKQAEILLQVQNNRKKRSKDKEDLLKSMKNLPKRKYSLTAQEKKLKLIQEKLIKEFEAS